MISFTQLNKSFVTLSASYKDKLFSKVKSVFLLLANGNLKLFIKQFCTETEFGKTEIVPVCVEFQIKPILENILHIY